MIRIPLTQGFEAIIDDEDARLAEHRWYAQRDACEGLVYARRWAGTENGRQIPKRLHREVLAITDPSVIVDHINGDGLDCRRCNLRIASPAQNARNLGGPRKDNQTSPYLGVTFRHGKFRARIQRDGRSVQIGSFPSAEEANEARLKYESEIWGTPLRRGAR
jgi:hypothetical protein